MKTKSKPAPVTTPTRPLATAELSTVVGGSGTKSTAGTNPLYQSFTGRSGSNPLHKA
jgi:hypothetical protein